MGTFVTCVGVLGAMKIGYASYMPVMLAVMEIPGCLLALYLVARLRRREMDAAGNLPSEPGHDPSSVVKADPDERVLDGEMLREVFLNPGLYLLFGGIVCATLTSNCIASPGHSSRCSAPDAAVPSTKGVL